MRFFFFDPFQYSRIKQMIIFYFFGFLSNLWSNTVRRGCGWTHSMSWNNPRHSMKSIKRPRPTNFPMHPSVLSPHSLHLCECHSHQHHLSDTLHTRKTKELNAFCGFERYKKKFKLECWTVADGRPGLSSYRLRFCFLEMWKSNSARLHNATGPESVAHRC